MLEINTGSPTWPERVRLAPATDDGRRGMPPRLVDALTDANFRTARTYFFLFVRRAASPVSIVTDLWMQIPADCGTLEFVFAISMSETNYLSLSLSLLRMCFEMGRRFPPLYLSIFLLTYHNSNNSVGRIFFPIHCCVPKARRFAMIYPYTFWNKEIACWK